MAVAAPVAAQTPATSFSGHATGVIALVNDPVTGDPLVNETLVEAGPLPAEGGSDSDELLDASIADLLTAEVISAETEGAGNRAESSAEIAGLDLLVEGLVDVSSTTLSSNAIAECGANGAEVRGDSVVEDLVVNETAIKVTGEPNQRVTLADEITVIINEQDSEVATDGTFGEITVNALHVIVGNPTNEGTLVDVILAQSYADVTCMHDSSTDGPIEALQGSTGAPVHPIPATLVLLGGLAVSMYLIRPLLRR